MKLKIGIILAVLAAMIPAANAVIVNIEVGDQPLRPRAGVLCRPCLLRLGTGALDVASPSQGLGSRLLRAALKKAQFD